MLSQSTWQRHLGQNIDASIFEENITQYFQALSCAAQELYNLDGKVVCRTVDHETEKQLHLLAL